MSATKQVQHTLHLNPFNSERLKELAVAEGTSESAQVNLALAAFFKAKREGVAYSVALALTAPLKTEAEERRRELLAVAQDVDKPDRIRIESYVEAQHDIPPDLVELARDMLGDPDTALERDESHYEDGESLRFIPAGFGRYRLTREYWFDDAILTDPAVAEKVVAFNIALGKDELAMRQRLAQILANPPNAEESAYEYYSRLHKISLEESATRIARGE